MWQNPLLPPHLFFQSLLLGSAILLPLVVLTMNGSRIESFISVPQYDQNILLWALAVFSLIHLLMVWGEVSLTHPTAHARLAIWEMVKGRYKNDFWTGIILSFFGGLFPLLAALGVVSTSIGIAGSPFALIGLMLFENAYVQAGQSVPLA
jgi:hypothetical protein